MVFVSDIIRVVNVSGTWFLEYRFADGVNPEWTRDTQGFDTLEEAKRNA